MSTPNELSLAVVQGRVDPSIWEARCAVADAEAEVLARVLARVRSGMSRRAAIAEGLPDQPLRSVMRRLRRFEQGGRDALIDRRAPLPKARKVTAEVRGALRALAHEHPRWTGAELTKALNASVGEDLGESTVREALRELGLARPPGPPRGRSGVPAREAAPEEEVTALPLAGAELLKAVEEEVGAVQALTKALGDHLEALPAPEGPVADDRSDRDARGRFLESYNAPKSRTEAELGGKFDTVERRRSEKDLREMRVANSSVEARYRKDLALTLLPVVVDAPRWSVLAHWQGEHLSTLVGHPYMPSTLDKHARELKLAGASEVAREATAAFWMAQDGVGKDGGLIAYIDATTKPVWTHHFTRSAKVSSTGRVQPAMSTVWLNSGSGTPLVYRTFSGHTSVPRQVASFLRTVESATGSGTTKRLVVLDRESHAVWLFKELTAGGWPYIIPLRTSVTGPKARFEDVGAWTPYGSSGDEVCDGWLWLNDSRPGEEAIRHRVVGRRRHRTGKIAWYATSTAQDEYDAAAVIDRYFDRWPLQEQVFRAGSGRIGLDVHHGYGKRRVTNVAVVDALEQLTAKIEGCDRQITTVLAERERLTAEHTDWTQAESDLRACRSEVATEVERLVSAQDTMGPEFATCYADLQTYQRWLDEARDALARLDRALRAVAEQLATLQGRRSRHEVERAKRASQTTIFTVDTELDEIMTAYKLTFMNLANRLLNEHMQEKMELDTLIRSVLTLPGQRVLTDTTETIRIYRQPRDPRSMAAVDRACASLNALGLMRGPDKQRRLRLELVDPPAGLGPG